MEMRIFLQWEVQVSISGQTHTELPTVGCHCSSFGMKFTEI